MTRRCGLKQADVCLSRLAISFQYLLFFDIPLRSCEIFILSPYSVLFAHESLNDSCDNTVTVWQWLHSKVAEKNILGELSLISENKQLWTWILVCSLMDMYMTEFTLHWLLYLCISTIDGLLIASQCCNTEWLLFSYFSVWLLPCAG